MLERMLILLVVTGIGAGVYCLFRCFSLWKAVSAASHGQLPENFKTGVPGIILFTADFCAPCKLHQQPAIQRLVDMIGTEKIQYIQVDVQDNPEVAQHWGVMTLPTTIVLDSNGKPREVNYGVTSTEKLKHQLEAIA